MKMKKHLFYWIFLINQILTIHANSHKEEKIQHSERISVAGFEIEKFETHITILIFLLIVVILKMVYHRLQHIFAFIPESCILILLGFLFGIVLKYSMRSTTRWDLTSDLFFIYLLPPIILDSAFSITNKTFGANIGIILIFAVLGTIINFFIIGFSLFGLQHLGVMHFPDLTLKRSLLYSSLIVAVDPVAVLAIFEDLGVNYDLYFMVFGESLLNDAVTIVLYQIMEAFSKKENVLGEEIGLGIAKFFTVSFGAFAIGLIVGIICCFLTRFTKSCRIFEPLILFVTAYLSYILADLFEWSGIISMIGCGCMQAGYAFHNLSVKSIVIIRRVVKMVAQVSEAIIFLYLGLETFISRFEWHTGFYFWSLALCLFARGFVVMILCFFINVSKMHRSQINFVEQFVITYGGLRGAVAYSLATLIKAEYVGGSYVRSVFISSTLFTIFITVGFMGVTMKPLAKLLHVKLLKLRGLSLTYEMNTTVIGHLTAGVEAISGIKGENYVRDMLLMWDDNYLRRILLRDPITHDEKIIKTYKKICLTLHQAMINPKESEHHFNKLSETYKRLEETKRTSDESFPLEIYSDDLPRITTPLPDDEEDSLVKKKRLSVQTDADILELFNHTRRQTLAGNFDPNIPGGSSFKSKLHDSIIRRKKDIHHRRYFPKLNQFHILSKSTNHNTTDPDNKNATTTTDNNNYVINNSHLWDKIGVSSNRNDLSGREFVSEVPISSWQNKNKMSLITDELSEEKIVSEIPTASDNEWEVRTNILTPLFDDRV